MGVKQEKALSVFDPNDIDLSFLAPNEHAKLNQILFKIATAVLSDDSQTHTEL